MDMHRGTRTRRSRRRSSGSPGVRRGYDAAVGWLERMDERNAQVVAIENERERTRVPRPAPRWVNRIARIFRFFGWLAVVSWGVGFVSSVISHRWAGVAAYGILLGLSVMRIGLGWSLRTNRF
jgi:hypothetical protein